MMVSNVDASGEGWAWVDKYLNSQAAERAKQGKLSLAGSTTLAVSADKGQQVSLVSEVWGSPETFAGHLPTVIHFCQNYRQVGEPVDG